MGQYFKEKEYIRLFKNFSFLAFIQGANFLLPLLVIPHLVKVLGIEKFGLVSFAQVIILYLVIFSEYAFNLTATKEVSENRDNPQQLTAIFNTVISSRLLLSFICLLIITLMVIVIPQFRKDWPLYLLSLSMVFGQAIVPIWFFLGIEQMKYITLVNLVSKLLFTLLTFVVISQPSDYIYANMLHGVGSMVAGVISFILVRKFYKIRFRISRFKDIKALLISTFPIFISHFATNIYMNINIVILNFVSTPEIVGMYSIAEKVFIAAKHLISVVFQTIYPFGCKLKLQSEQQFKVFFTKFAYSGATLFLLLGFFTFVFANQIIKILAGEEIFYCIHILKLLSFVPFIIAINIPAYQTALIYNLRKEFSIIMIFASVINVTANLVLGSYYAAYGTVAAITLTELFVTIAFNAVIFNKVGIVFFRPELLLNRSETLSKI